MDGLMIIFTTIISSRADIGESDFGLFERSELGGNLVVTQYWRPWKESPTVADRLF